MIRLFKWFLWGDAHLHKWRDVEKSECTGNGGRWTRFYCQCEICGKHKAFDA